MKTRGRYQLKRVARRPTMRVLLPVAVLAASATLILYPASVDDPLPANAPVDSFGDRDAPPYDDLDRSVARGDTEPAPAPTHVAMLASKVINGRLQPEPVEPPRDAGGRYQAVRGSSVPPAGTSGEVVKYLVEVEEGLPFDPEDFATAVHTILNDERGWGADGSLRFQRVDEGAVQFRVSLSSPAMTDEQCAPLRTLGRVSCWNGSRAVINAKRWGTGAATYGDDLRSYREYLINHEVGHALGHDHVSCPGAGKPALVMVQQTRSLEGCQPNPWPHP